MHRVAIITSALLMTLAAVAGVATPAEAGHRPTYVNDTCFRVRMRPESIVFACADGNYYVDQLQWRSWHTWRAAGRGLFHINDCKPDCADGTFHVRRGRIRLRSRIRCDGIGKHVFDRARIVYERAWHHTRRLGVRHIGCPS